MKKLALLSALALVVAVGCKSAERRNPLEGMPAGAPAQKIKVTAKKFDFVPAEIHVKQGNHVVLEIQSLDVTHGIAIPHYGIDVTLPPEKKVTVEFYAAQAGTYPFHCSHFCGLGHGGMKGKVIVEPAVAP